MKKENYYQTGTFAKKAHVSKKTLRYYNDHNILKPSYVDELGYHYYSDNDFAKLQQILFLKYLSFSLADIKELCLRADDSSFWLWSLAMQTNMLDEHIEQMLNMKKGLEDAKKAIEKGQNVDWGQMILLSNSSEMEEKLKKQYLNSSNILSRINLHKTYGKNSESWFSWLFRVSDIKKNEKVLELGSGDGSLWLENIDKIKNYDNILLTDISDGIVRETKKKLNNKLKIKVMDATKIEAKDNSLDVVIANHLFFYLSDVNEGLQEVRRVLKPNGRLICSTYSKKHMEEVSKLVKEFDERIVLSADKLYEKFGKENGKEILSPYFKDVTWVQYKDELLVTEPEPLIAYILSCHGNQNRYIIDRYHEFYKFVKSKTDKGFKISKDAGVFIAK